MPLLSILAALADPTRCRIIEILHDGAQPVHVLASHFDISRPAISRHLRVLRQARLISENKVGRENRYALQANHLKPVRDWLEGLAPAAKPAKQPAPASKQRKRAGPVTAIDPIFVTTPTEATSKAARKPSGSQMGFDF